MPLPSDLSRIRAILETDRPWAAYALGDLAPGHREHAEWHAPADGRDAALLLYHGFGTPVLFALGEPEALDELLSELDAPRLYLSIRPDALPLIERRYVVERQQRMVRMLYQTSTDPPVLVRAVSRLTPDAAEAVRLLYADGEAVGEAPDFFHPEMLRTGVFYGAWEGETLVAAAGTHLVAPSESVAALGNVYTRRDRRGLGLGAAVTAAVTGELRRRGLRTVVLNVAVENRAARRVYERLGYRPYCEFYEGLAICP